MAILVAGSAAPWFGSVDSRQSRRRGFRPFV
uniref:Uncharacterized protein n=1 Tax=Arundo donax TaxID=35708 RepID=A0A0A9AP79_ARUDO